MMKLFFKSYGKELQSRQLASHSIDTIRNKDVYKLSPFKELTPEQLEIKLEIIDYCQKNIQKTENKESIHD